MNKIYNLDLSRTITLVDHTEITPQQKLNWTDEKKMFGTSAISNFLYVIKVCYITNTVTNIIFDCNRVPSSLRYKNHLSSYKLYFYVYYTWMRLVLTLENHVLSKPTTKLM